jgi:hypothetical protein
MAVDHVKSTPVTNLDASPVVANTEGEGAAAYLMCVSSGDVVGVASSSVNATYQFVRVPSNCKIKSILFSCASQGAGAMDFGVYYATDGLGNKPTALLAANAISQALFAAAVTLGDVLQSELLINSFTPAQKNQPLWQAAGLSADPGGNFDIVGTVKTTAITTGTGKMGMTVVYTN